MDKIKSNEDINIEIDELLEERKINTLIGLAFLAVWILSMLVFYNQN